MSVESDMILASMSETRRYSDEGRSSDYVLAITTNKVRFLPERLPPQPSLEEPH